MGKNLGIGVNHGKGVRGDESLKIWSTSLTSTKSPLQPENSSGKDTTLTMYFREVVNTLLE